MCSQGRAGSSPAFGTKGKHNCFPFHFMQSSNHKYFVYAITSTVRNYIYVGMTNNLVRRISEHNNGYNKTTKPYLPFKTIYIEEFDSRISVRKKEKYLKSGVGKEFLKSL